MAPLRRFSAMLAAVPALLFAVEIASSFVLNTRPASRVRNFQTSRWHAAASVRSQDGAAAARSAVALLRMSIGDGTPVCRREFLTSAAIAGAVAFGAVFRSPETAMANGMLDFPPARLNNRYFLMRSGEGGSDRRGLIQSHPIDKLHTDNGLTDEGVREAQKAASVLRSLGIDNAFIWADISSRAQETARVLAEELDIRQERVVPEYAFLEPRGMGIFDGQVAATVLPEVYEADAKDQQWRPPPNTNGTPNESVGDVFVRVRQLMSKLETQYQGEDVIIISPDSDCLSVLQAFVLGEELGTHSRYYLRPGEGRQLRVSADTEYLYDDRKVMRAASAGRVKTVEVAGGGRPFEIIDSKNEITLFLVTCDIFPVTRVVSLFS